MVSVSSYAQDGALTLSKVKDNMFDEETRRNTYDQVALKPMSRRTEAEVKAGGDSLNPKTDHSLNLKKKVQMLSLRKRRSHQKKLQIFEAQRKEG